MGRRKKLKQNQEVEVEIIVEVEVQAETEEDQDLGRDQGRRKGDILDLEVDQEVITIEGEDLGVEVVIESVAAVDLLIIARL